MAGKESQDVYGSTGSVPDAAPQGGFAPTSGVRSSPENFGGQVGAALVGAGKTGEELGQRAQDLAMYTQGIVNETNATNAETELIKQNASVRANLLSLEGSAASNALPGALAQINANHQALRSTLSGGALRQYDMLGSRQLANLTSEFETYGAQQRKVGLRSAGLANGQAWLQNLAANPTMGNVNETIAAHTTANAASIPDGVLIAHHETGAMSFAPTAEGDAAKAQYRFNNENSRGQVWNTAISSLGDKDPIAARDMLNANYDRIPVQARAVIESTLAPKIRQSYASGVLQSVQADINNGYANMVANHKPSSNSAENKPIPGLGGLTGADVPPVTPGDLGMAEGSQEVSLPPPAPTTRAPGIPPPSYPLNDAGTRLTPVDYMASHRLEFLDKADAYAQSVMPDDPTFRSQMREMTTNFINQNISDQKNGYKQSRTQVMKAISGQMSNGKPPGTEHELYALPGVKAAAESLASGDQESVDFYNNIPTYIARHQQAPDGVNSPNGYETISRSLSPVDPKNPNGIYSEDHLNSLLGRKDGNAINLKDYTDAKKALELPDTVKSLLKQNMDSISKANGNADGNGKQRAVDYYNAALRVIQNKTQDGSVKPESLADPKNKDYIGNLTGMFMPARVQQIAKAAQTARNIPVFASPTDPGFKALPPGSQFRTADGRIGTKK